MRSSISICLVFVVVLPRPPLLAFSGPGKHHRTASSRPTKLYQPPYTAKLRSITTNFGTLLLGPLDAKRV